MVCIRPARHVDRSAPADRGASEQPGAPRSGAHQRTLRGTAGACAVTAEALPDAVAKAPGD